MSTENTDTELMVRIPAYGWIALDEVTEEMREHPRTQDALMHVKTREEVAELRERLNEFKSLCFTHDWYYQMSEDPRVVSRGRKQFQDIKQLHDELSCPFTYSQLCDWVNVNYYFPQEEECEVSSWFSDFIEPERV